MNDRARLTPVDMVFAAVALAALAFLGEPLYQALAANDLDTGTELLFRMLVPALVAMLIFTTYRTSLLGGGRNG